jgi:kelch-like protein 10
MRHYCITCKHLICIECIVDHSGHEFVRKEESTYVLKENADNIVSSLEEMMQKTESLLKDGLKMTKDLKQTKLKDMKKIDEKFEIISKKIMMKKALLKKEYNDAFNVELNKVN